MQVGEFKGQTITGAETGIPRLDRILHRMLEDGKVWPYVGRFFEKKLDELVIPRVFATAPFWWMSYYTPDARFWSIDPPDDPDLQSWPFVQRARLIRHD